MDKLQLRSTAELIRFAILNGNGLDEPADGVCSLASWGEVLPALTQGLTATQGWSTMSMIDKREANEDSNKSSAYSEGRYS